MAGEWWGVGSVVEVKAASRETEGELWALGVVRAIQRQPVSGHGGPGRGRGRGVAPNSPGTAKDIGGDRAYAPDDVATVHLFQQETEVHVPVALVRALSFAFGGAAGNSVQPVNVAVARARREVENPWVVCPFDKNHAMPLSTFQKHITVCRQRHNRPDLRSCPFNFTHIIAERNFDDHVASCPDRPVDELLEALEDDSSSGPSRTESAPSTPLQSPTPSTPMAGRTASGERAVAVGHNPAVVMVLPQFQGKEPSAVCKLCDHRPFESAIALDQHVRSKHYSISAVGVSADAPHGGYSDARLDTPRTELPRKTASNGERAAASALDVASWTLRPGSAAGGPATPPDTLAPRARSILVHTATGGVEHVPLPSAAELVRRSVMKPAKGAEPRQSSNGVVVRPEHIVTAAAAAAAADPGVSPAALPSAHVAPAHIRAVPPGSSGPDSHIVTPAAAAAAVVVPAAPSGPKGRPGSVDADDIDATRLYEHLAHLLRQVDIATVVPFQGPATSDTGSSSSSNRIATPSLR